MAQNMIRFVQSVLLLALTCKAVSCTDDSLENSDADTRKLPSIWSLRQDGRAEVEQQSYRIKSEVLLLNSGKSFRMDEWASSVSEKFKLEITELSTGYRRTLLCYKSTNECFRYEPFRCSLMDAPNESLFPELAEKFPYNPDSFIPSGVGSLWIHALKQKPKFTPAQGVIDQGSENNGSKSIFRTYDKFSYNQVQDFSFRMTFFVRPTQGDGSISADMIDLVTSGSDKAKEVVRIKILYAEVPYKSPNGSEEEIFELPMGYGCTRGGNFNHAFRSLPGILSLNHFPRLLRMEVIATQPLDPAHMLKKWKTHSITTRMLTGRLSLDSETSHDYFLLDTQDYAPRQSSPKIAGTELRQATLRRHKHIFDLGENGFASNSSSATYYLIDEHTRKCIAHGQKAARYSTSMELLDAGLSTYTGGNISMASLILTPQFLNTLLTQTNGYHLLREEKSSSSKYINYLHEKRVDSYAFESKDGGTVWSGPVSFVRRQSIFAKWFNDSKISDGEQKISLEMIFLSKSVDKLMSKVHIDIVENRFIDYPPFHRELDVSSCFSHLGHSNSLRSDRTTSKRQNGPDLDFVVVYIVASKDIVERLANDNYSEAKLYTQFLRSILSASSGRLDPLQLAGLEIDFTPESVRISGKLLNKPVLFDYEPKIERKFSRMVSNLLFTEYKPNEEACGASCGHFACSSFVYCPATKICDLMVKDTSQVNSTIFEDGSGCVAYTKHQTSRDHLSPIQFLLELSQTVNKAYNIGNLLVLEANYNAADGTRQTIQLTPSRVEIGSMDSDTTSDMLSEMGLAYNGSDGRFGEPFEQEYVRFLMDSKYKSLSSANQDFPIQLANHRSYDDCELLCKEIDCQSFSYCQMDKTCQVSQLHRSSLIEKVAEPAILCSIMVRDYLSKFQHSVQVTKSLASIKSSKSVQAASPRDCAVRCMEEQDFKCRSFIFCPGGEQEGDCHLRTGYRVSGLDGGKVDSKGEQGGERATCSAYKRSHLADFDKFYRKSLPSRDENLVIVLRGLGAEDCALECASQNGSCLAFHVCRSESSIEPTCAVFSVTKGNQFGADAGRVREGLESDEKCTSFVVSLKVSASYLLNGENPGDESDATSNVSDYNATQWLDSHSRLLQVCLLAIGLASGYASALMLHKRRKPS